MLLRFTSCALNGPPLGIQDQSQNQSCNHSFHFISFQSLASVTHGHGTQALYWGCAKQKDGAKIFHCFKFFAPIATIRLFNKLFAYMILGRVEAQLETHQPEEQHGFRGGRRVEEHLVTTHLVLDKLSSANVPIWIVSLDLSKAFDRVQWRALSEQGLSEHMIWMIQNLYRNQQGQVVGSNGCSRSFDIHGGVRQGCVLSPRLFCSVLEMSMANRRDEMEHLGLDLRDGGRSLLDLRFADDILIFWRRLPCHWRTLRQTC